ncbi:3'-5' exonuclease [Xylanibacter rodentium]|jgi:DNA polymerase-3 subunit epsilon|uniref:3'-5' exonuclease n=1 Tax=Xylanibacter rodentium TaxID=2736289 RepID=A0ABX2AUA9_9BACT|nr:3'-5' exonuclease [Xylanibacter rodentium]NPE10996.1 3'-5' exonuclease [Prevotella sp. PJ1A]NPE14156.1 3'-5' exonuclease [Xylanibacter rodentium]NPE37462.1 3'-5' exonuclease [Prevotella sp. PCJ2]
MKLNLQKPLVVFDLETTGLDLVKDRIIQISYIKVYPDGREERGNELINPERPIPELVTSLTGISNADVQGKPTFKAIASRLNESFKGCDFAGFNSNHFDIPMLAEEFLRAGIDFDFAKCRLIDAQNIFHKMERRNLAAAYKFYCGREMEEDFEAHRADQDTEATYRVLMGQLDKYNPETEPDKERHLQNDVAFLSEFSRQNNNVDFAGRIIWSEVKDKNGKQVLDKDGKPQMTEVFNFGKHKGESVAQVLRFDPGYYSWILSGDFTYNTKQVLTRIRLRESKLNS